MNKGDFLATKDKRFKEADSHFAFGENWANFAEGIGDGKIYAAVEGLQKLLGADEVRGRRFLDIGSGSGLHALAALRLGASEVVAVDIDKKSVATTRAVLNKYAPAMRYRVEQRSIFEIHPAQYGQFDIVYSWGVLHHTGDMFEAIRRAAALVAPNGLFAFALYRKTTFCWFWKLEKRLYSRAPAAFQRIAQRLFAILYRLAFWRSLGPLQKYNAFLRGYQDRGMDYYHDVHDWLGGFPYESISPFEVEALMEDLGLVVVRRFVYETKGRAALFGSGCDEYLYRAGA